MKKKKTYMIVLISPIIAILLSLIIGNYNVSISEVFMCISNILFKTSYDINEKVQFIIMEIRLPRLILAAMVGGSLAVSGTVYQSIFANPLVSSSMLGVSNGAGFGAALAIVLFSNSSMIYILAFIFGISAVILSYNIGKIYDVKNTIMLVLGGVIVSSVFSSLTSLIKYIADPETQLPSIVFWLMGSLANATYKDIYISAIPIFGGMLLIILLRWRLNLMSLGDDDSKMLGINTQINRILFIGAATMSTAGAVCVSGNIGWIGIVIPHICRILFGADTKYLVPTSISLGATFLICIDNLSRSMTAGEIPLGILTALVGTPFFIYILKISKEGNSY